MHEAHLFRYNNTWAFIEELIQDMRYHKMKLIFYAWIKIAIGGPPQSRGINGIHNGKVVGKVDGFPIFLLLSTQQLF